MFPNRRPVRAGVRPPWAKPESSRSPRSDRGEEIDPTPEFSWLRESDWERTLTRQRHGPRRCPPPLPTHTVARAKGDAAKKKARQHSWSLEALIAKMLRAVPDTGRQAAEHMRVARRTVLSRSVRIVQTYHSLTSAGCPGPRPCGGLRHVRKSSIAFRNHCLSSAPVNKTRGPGSHHHLAADRPHLRTAIPDPALIERSGTEARPAPTPPGAIAIKHTAMPTNPAPLDENRSSTRSPSPDHHHVYRHHCPPIRPRSACNHVIFTGLIRIDRALSECRDDRISTQPAPDQPATRSTQAASQKEAKFSGADLPKPQEPANPPPLGRFRRLRERAVSATSSLRPEHR